MRWLTEASPKQLRSLIDGGEYFWLDLVKPTQTQVADQARAIAADPQAAARALRFGEAPHLRLFHGHVQLVFYGAQPTDNGPVEPVEVHVYVSDHWVLSLREKPCQALDDLRRELEDSPPATNKALVARVLGALAESLEESMEPVDETIEELAQAAADETRPARGLRREILGHRSRLVPASRLLRRQRDYVEHAVDEIRELPGFDPGGRHELRDVAGQMVRAADRVDDALHRLATALDQLNAADDNRLNAVMERLTVVATIFLPLTVVTGFFGMNFGWMLNRINSLADFLIFGVGLTAVSGVLIYLWMRSRLRRAEG